MRQNRTPEVRRWLQHGARTEGRTPPPWLSRAAHPAPGDRPTCRGSWSARKEPMRLQESPPIQPRRNHRDTAWSMLPVLQALMYWGKVDAAKQRMEIKPRPTLASSQPSWAHSPNTSHIHWREPLGQLEKLPEPSFFQTMAAEVGREGWRLPVCRGRRGLSGNTRP
uniref:72 kDa type IV collagenase n=1 Tax=Sus scrofa TaxID=9823 RepID=A0A480HL91_PIG